MILQQSKAENVDLATPIITQMCCDDVTGDVFADRQAFGGHVTVLAW